MNWAAISFDWNHVRAFLATVEHGSLSGAARALDQTQPTLSRQISVLEDALGLTLFERGTRKMQITDAGAELLSHVRAMADAASRISLSATGQSTAVEGVVRLTCSDAMAAYAMPECLIALRNAHPGIRIELIPLNQVSDLTRRDADIAIRHVRPEQPDLVARRLADIEVGLFVAPSLAERYGPLETAQQISALPFIGFEKAERLIPQLKHMGLDVSVESFGITTTSGSAMYELARAGAGVAILPVTEGRDRMGLVRVLDDRPTMSVPVWLVTHREIQTSRRIRLTFDHLAGYFSERRWSTLGAG
ncbi:LysR family transcriptional regulator [Pontivivens insulae]|uniref:HTH-type transcriptional regulator CatM n=1 Tax=Pontivivens insulae TaxID=1639689 RepID=A0A2R8A6W7_9RHOB|nr:LysR family transcriptional regulator [Pontivivens insulae]RED18077.1 LysR family transcriptional regulator [Pontivivens insulae]SPF27974.1 HTH-type transcriptional regulator CatM [Pontivivens insulae]